MFVGCLRVTEPRPFKYGGSCFSASLLPFARGDRMAWRSYLHGEHNGREEGEESECVPGNQYLTDGRQKFI